MTRKYLRVIAGAIANIGDETARYAAALALADELRYHNSRFDRCRFLLACKAVDVDDPRR